MFTATVPIVITTFNPISSQGPTIVAALGPLTNTSAPHSGGSTVFGGTGQSITVTTPPTYTGAVQLTFQLNDSNNVLVGVAVKTKTPKGGTATASAGRQQFRTVSINRDQTGSQMVVTDTCLAQFNTVLFDYVILVQAVTGPNAGAIGIIDPDETNNPGD